MLRKIVWEDAQGRLIITTPVRSVNDPPGMTDEEIEQRAYNDRVPKDAVNVKFIDSRDVPSDRTVRSRWKQASGGFGGAGKVEVGR